MSHLSSQPAARAAAVSTPADALRFAVLDSPNAAFPVRVERWKTIEALGFDSLLLPDHTADFTDLDSPWHDGWIALAAAACHTTRIRVGTLVSNPILRHPAILAKQAAALDHLSNRRLDLGIGTGIAAFDHAAVGADYWSHDERVRRFGEYVAIVDQLLRGGGNPVSVTGRFYTTTGTRIVPHPPQQPRPPITIGGQSGGVLRIAAATADCWNSDGHPDRSVEEVFAATQRQTARLDDLCVAAGRAPTTLRRSLMLIHALDAWADADALERLVERFWPLGIREFVVFWPGDDRLAALRRAASIVIPRLKQNLDGSN